MGLTCRKVPAKDVEHRHKAQKGSGYGIHDHVENRRQERNPVAEAEPVVAVIVWA